MFTQSLLKTALLFPLFAGLTLAAQTAAPKPAATKPAVKKSTAKKPAAVVARPGEKLEEVAVLETEAGTIVVRFFPEVAPGHVANYKDLVKTGFYNGSRFHRTVPGFMIQGGDPNTKDMSKADIWGSGDGPRQLAAEFNQVHHARGILSMARSNDPNSGSCQFFLMHGDAGFLDGKYTVFGEIVSGIEVVDKIVGGPVQGGPMDTENSKPRVPIMIKSARLETRSLPPSASLAVALPPAK